MADETNDNQNAAKPNNDPRSPTYSSDAAAMTSFWKEGRCDAILEHRKCSRNVT